MENLIEIQIIEAVKKLLTGRVNEILSEWQTLIPLFEIAEFQNMTAVVPVVTLSSCERSEKERIIKVDAYSLTIAFTVPETADSELFCYAYTSAVDKVVRENTTFGGIVDKVSVSGKKYIPPKTPHCGQGWEVVITLRITKEGIDYAG